MPTKNVSPLLLDAIAPDATAADADELHYPSLREAALTHYPDLYASIDDFWHTYETAKKRGHDVPEVKPRDLLVTALKIQEARSKKARDMWTRRYTEGSITLYGRPWLSEVSKIVRAELEDFAFVASTNLELEPAEYVVRHAYQHLLRDDEDVDDDLQTPRRLHAQSFEERYRDVLNAVRDHMLEAHAEEFAYIARFDDKALITTEETYQHFVHLLGILQKKNPGWASWKVHMRGDAGMSVSSARRTIYIGRRRGPTTVSHFKGMFAHEVLVHAQRSVNGDILTPSGKLATGLPGYLPAEEGLGILAEAAIRGHVPYRIKDRYIDIALALGLGRADSLSRHELFNVAFNRAILRQVMTRDVITRKQLRTNTWQHVNRIYRGTLGSDDCIGVFTKDVVYFRGFTQVANYIADHMDRWPAESIFEHMLRGKFNPRSRVHGELIHASLWRDAIATIDRTKVKKAA